MQSEVDQLRQCAEKWLVEYLGDYRQSSEQTIRGYRRDLKLFLAFCRRQGISSPEEVTRELVMRYATGQRGVSGATKRRRLASISSWFTYLQNTGVVHEHPAKGIPLPHAENRIPEVVAPEIIDTLLHLAEEPWQRCALVLLLTTGIRRGELSAIRVGDVNLAERRLLVRGKGRRQRVVELAQCALEAICDYLPHRPQVEDDRLLLYGRGRPVTGQYLHRMLRKLLEAGGIEAKVTPHCFRHTFATTLIRQGVDVRTVQELMGHRDLSTTARYLHADSASRRTAVELVAHTLVDD